jgi:hypothetical protein
VPAEHASDPRQLDVLWDWCLSAHGREAARDASAQPEHDAQSLLDALIAAL